MTLSAPANRRSVPRRLHVLIAGIVLSALFIPVDRTFAMDDEIIDRVLAVAAGDVILLSDVRAARVLGLVPPSGVLDPDRAVLSSLIDRALMLDEVDRYAPPEPSVSEVDGAFAEIRERLDSLAALNIALANLGLDERQLRETLRQNLRIRGYLAQRFSGDTPERVQTAIDEWMAGLRRRADIVDVYQRP